MKKTILIVLLILVIDQITKIWVKTNLHMGGLDTFSLIPGVLNIEFVENPGMAYGKTWGGEMGKVVLTSLRIVLIGVILYYIKNSLKTLNTNYFIIPMSFILAGAIGNVLDSIFYGMIFDKGVVWDVDQWKNYYPGIAKFSRSGYSGVLRGSVVDMLQFQVRWPSFMPFNLADKLVFSPIFNVADTAISIGAMSLVLFNRKAFKK